MLTVVRRLLLPFFLLSGLFSGNCAGIAATDYTHSRYRTETIIDGSDKVTILHDTRGGSACIRPGSGNTCTSLTLAAPDGKLCNLLMPSQRGGGGIPVLFPWPGVLAGGQYALEGQIKQFPVVGKNRDPMHGFVNRRAWRRLSSGADANGAWVTSRITSADCPETSAGYPFYWSLTLTHRLTNAGLTITAEVTNTGTRTMPFGFGFHPWLCAPIAGRASKENCLVHIPGAAVWEHQKFQGIVPSSAPHAFPKYLRRTVSKAEDLRTPARIGKRETAIYSAFQASSGTITCSLSDPDGGRTTRLTFSENLGTVVLFDPGEKPAVCIEPISCPPNALNLFGHGITGTGLTLLKPGSTWYATLTCSLH